MQVLQNNYREFKKLGTEIVAISVDSPAENAKVRGKLGLEFEILSDSSKQTIKDYKLFHDIKGGIARPAEYLIGANGKIVQVWITENFRVRTRAETLLQQIKSLQLAKEGKDK